MLWMSCSLCDDETSEFNVSCLYSLCSIEPVATTYLLKSQSFHKANGTLILASGGELLLRRDNGFAAVFLLAARLTKGAWGNKIGRVGASALIGRSSCAHWSSGYPRRLHLLEGTWMIWGFVLIAYSHGRHNRRG
jgi:hypothetical protein